jgi:hypothetical protein
MKKYKEIKIETPANFKRMTGISKEAFQNLCNKTNAYIKEEKKCYFIETTWCKKIQTFCKQIVYC